MPNKIKQLNWVHTLDRGAEINHQMDTGETALMIAARSGNEDMVRLLVRHGADINLKNNKGFTALDIAIHNANGEVRDFLEKQ